MGGISLGSLLLEAEVNNVFTSHCLKNSRPKPQRSNGPQLDQLCCSVGRVFASYAHKPWALSQALHKLGLMMQAQTCDLSPERWKQENQEFKVIHGG